MLNKVSFVLFFTGVEVCTWHPWHPCGTGIPSRSAAAQNCASADVIGFV